MAVNQQEVRVRLSAEGMAEVVSAFQKVSESGKKSAKETSDAFRQLTGQFRELGGLLLGGLSIAYAAEGFKELVSSTLESAEALQRLSKETGLSTTALQAVGRAARDIGISAEVANSGLERFTTAIGRAQAGSRQTEVALADLGIKTKTLASLTPDQKLLLVAQRLASIPDPARRASDEMALFSRSGIEMDQVLVRIGQEGFGPFVAHLKELGLFLDDQTLAQMATLQDRLRDVGDMAKGLGTQFLIGLTPALTSVADAITKVTAAGEGFRAVGAFIGDVIRYVAAGFQGLGIDIANFAADATVLWEGFAEALSRIAHGKIRDAVQSIKEAWREAGEIDKQAEADKARAEAAYEAGPAKALPAAAGASPRGPTPAATQLDDSIARARLQLVQAQLDNELKLYEAHDRLLLDEEKGAYDRGEISLKEYFARREAILSAEYDKQIDIARRKLAAEEKANIGTNNEAAQIQKAAREEQLKGQIEDLNEQRAAALAAERNQLHQEELRLDEQKIAAEVKLLEIEGKRTEAAKLKLQLEAQGLQRELAASGASAGEQAGAVASFTAQGTAAISYQDASQKAKADLSLLETQKKAIQDQINAGQIFSLDGQQKLLEVQREQLPALEQDAQAMLDYANAAKDPGMIASAEAFKEKVDEIKTSTDQSAQALKEMRAGVENAVGAGINTFLDDAIKKSKSLGQAFDDAAKQILDDLVKMALQIEEQQFLRAIFSGSLFGGGSGGGGGGLLGGLGGAIGVATGGYIRGPGTSTSDSIPALLSDREYVVNARAAAQPGALELLEALNAGASPNIRIPRLAGGGPVASFSSAIAAAPARAAAPVTLRIAPEALHLTLRDWFEREVADISSKR